MHFEIIDRIFNSDMIGDVYEKFYFDLAEHASALKNNFKLSSNDYSIKERFVLTVNNYISHSIPIVFAMTVMNWCISIYTVEMFMANLCIPFYLFQ